MTIHPTFKRFLLLLTATLLYGTTIKPSYRATNTSITLTALNSLANGSTWCGAKIDNTTNLDLDEQVTFVIKTGASGTLSTGYYGLYAYSCVGGTSTCTDGVSGSQGTFTPTSPTNLLPLGSVGPGQGNAVANGTTYTFGAFSVAYTFGGAMPAQWGVCVTNSTGSAVAASGNSVVYDSLQATSN